MRARDKIRRLRRQRPEWMGPLRLWRNRSAITTYIASPSREGAEAHYRLMVRERVGLRATAAAFDFREVPVGEGVLIAGPLGTAELTAGDWVKRHERSAGGVPGVGFVGTGF